MLMVSKKISEWQEIQLRNWCFVVFDNLESVKIKYEFDNGEEFYSGKIEFNFKFKKDMTPEGIQKTKGMEHLDSWTKSIFWADTKVKFKIGNRLWK